jgi:phage tail-like protein
MNDVDKDPAVDLYFKVVIDNHNIGTFITCSGLSMDVSIEPVKEGGNNGFTWKLPGRVEYGNVKLTRPIGPESNLVSQWIAGMSSGDFVRTKAVITALTPKAEELVSWTLSGVIPVKWEGPSFSAEGGKVAQETLELAHHGFEYKDQNKWV